MRRIMERLKLTVNEDKTTSVPDTAGAVRLSGLHLRAMLFTQGRACLHRHPAVEEEHQRMIGSVSEVTDRPHGCCGWMPRRWWVG